MQSKTYDPPELADGGSSLGQTGDLAPWEARLGSSLISSAIEGTILEQARLELSGRHTLIPPDISSQVLCLSC